ncbi:MAG: hypothetical protein M3Y33_19070, partial [Actinomycetota bacterium]|nr:hypothetical protein [Actinomycetota bacterium]
GITLAVQLAVAYAFPSLATALTPRRTIPGTAYAGHFISRQATRAGMVTTYLPDRYYWPAEIGMSAAILLAAALLATAATMRTARRPG